MTKFELVVGITLVSFTNNQELTEEEPSLEDYYMATATQNMSSEVQTQPLHR